MKTSLIAYTSELAKFIKTEAEKSIDTYLTTITQKGGDNPVKKLLLLTFIKRALKLKN